MNSGIDERGSLHFTRLWIRVSVLGTGWEIKNRCTIGRLFCNNSKTQRRGREKKKRVFQRYSKPFFSSPFPFDILRLAIFFSFSFSRAIYQFFFLFLFTKNASVLVHRILRVSWKLLLPLLFPFLHESLWKLKGCLGGTRKRVTLITDRLFSGPKAGRKLVISDPLLYKRDD